jgi:hypothetical protein
VIEPTRALALTGLETIHLSDALRNGSTVKDIEDEVSCLRPLLLVLASAYIELVLLAGSAEGPIEVTVTEAMVWLMRAKCRSGDMMGQIPIGVGLLRKLYAALLSFHSETEEIETTDEHVATLLESARFREFVDAQRAKSDPDPDTDGYAVGGA